MTGSYVFPKSMFCAIIKKIKDTPVNPRFKIYIKVGYKGLKLYGCVNIIYLMLGDRLNLDLGHLLQFYLK